MPRKTLSQIATGPRPGRASMRPRPDAAENLVDPVRRFQLARRASMRPRPDAAENRGFARLARGRADPASMRPRPDAAENREAQANKLETETELQ